jgi:Protein of unknown function (DUF3006)
VTTRLSFDRFEGKGKQQIAVLVADDGTTVNVPRPFLPPGAAPGDLLTLSFELDPGATARLKKETKSVQDDLAKSDPGGDIKL